MKQAIYSECIALFFLLLIMVTGCAKQKSSQLASMESKSQEKRNIIVGFSQIGAESAWRTCNTQSMKDAAAESGIQLLFANGEQKQENQIKAIRSFIVYQVDVIVFVPIVQDGWDNVLREAKEAGIPVIVIDRKIRTVDESLYAGYIGTDSVEEGRKAARYLVSKYGDKKGPYTILEIRGTDGSSAAEGRFKGFREVLAGNDKFTIIYSETGDFLRSRGREIARNLLFSSEYSNVADKNALFVNEEKVDIIFSHNDGMTLGFLEVLEQKNIRSGNDMTIITIDAEQDAIDALAAGKISCVIECNPKIGPEVMKFVKILVNGGSIPHLTHVAEGVFTQNTISLAGERGY